LLFNSKSKPKFFDSNYDVWNKEIFELSLAGLVPFGESIESIRISKNTASVSYGSKLSRKINFKVCSVFNDSMLSVENDLIEKQTKKAKVIDWISLKKCEQEDLQNINTTDDFVNRVIPYKSGRIDSNSNHKDIVVVSYLNKMQLMNFDFSDTMAKFKTKDLLQKHNIRGTVNRIEKLTGKEYRNTIDLTVTKREVICRDKNIYQSSESVKFY
tara:strand:- start:1458 stop:2096 length:639 start_codon:yes stop_codon:yes gene_type:complete